MAQVTDRTVGANPTGFDMRTELNNIIGALESDNSGSSEPLNPVAYMKWLDTSNATYYYYKERNHNNTAWVTLFRYTVATKVMEAVSNGVVLQDSALVHKTGNETIAGVKTFSSSPLIPSATTGGQAIRYDQSVKLTVDETIAGVKTFTSSPIVPTPTTGTQAANKAYVDNVAVTPDASTTVKGIVELATTEEAQAGTDDLRAITPLKLFNSLKGSNQLLSSSGYQKLHGGLIIQWGQNGAVQSVIFPIAFPNACLTVVATMYGSSSAQQINEQSTVSYTTTGFKYASFVWSKRWFAIGY